MKTPFRDLIAERHRKEYMVEQLEAHPEQFGEAVAIGLSPTDPIAWRAVWVLRESLGRKDTRLLPHIDAVLAVISQLNDGHQREWLKVLATQPLTEDQESILFDLCMDFWSAVGKAPSLRVTAFLGLERTVKRYPELMGELALVTEREYLESLSPGIHKSVEKRLAGLREQKRG